MLAMRKKKKITKELQQKFDSIINRNLYTKNIKLPPTEEEKEKARQEYLFFVKF